ncbi:MAG TPA: Mpo1-like protein [Gemmataceae bacterium]
MSADKPRRWNFPIARRVLGLADRARRNWLERHQNSFNFYIHLVGIPLAFAGLVLLLAAEWYWGVTALVSGYLLQYIGHAAEGNDMGEIAAVKRLFGLPYVAVAPRYRRPDAPPD